MRSHTMARSVPESMPLVGHFAARVRSDRVVEVVGHAVRALLRPVLAGRRDADQDVDRPRRASSPTAPVQRIARRQEALADEGLARVAGGAFEIVDVEGDDDDARVARALDDSSKALLSTIEVIGVRAGGRAPPPCSRAAPAPSLRSG